MVDGAVCNIRGQEEVVGALSLASTSSSCSSHFDDIVFFFCVRFSRFSTSFLSFFHFSRFSLSLTHAHTHTYTHKLSHWLTYLFTCFLPRSLCLSIVTGFLVRSYLIRFLFFFVYLIRLQSFLVTFPFKKSPF